MKKEVKDETYHSHWKETKLERKYRNSREAFSSTKCLVIENTSLLFGLGAVMWFFFAPYTLVQFGVKADTGIIPWIGGMVLLAVLAIFNPLESKLPSYETRIFWKICETLRNLDLYWESWYSQKPKEVFLKRADGKFRKALSYMEQIIPRHAKRAEMVKKQIRVPLKVLRERLKQKFLPMRLTPNKGIARVFNRLEELALIFYEHNLDKLLEFDKSLEGIPKSHVKKMDIRALFLHLPRSKIGKFVISFLLANVLALGIFFVYAGFSAQIFRGKVVSQPKRGKFDN